MRNMLLARKVVAAVLCTLIMAVIVLPMACAPAQPGEEKKVVKIGAILPVTGPASAIMQYGFRNMIDYFSYFQEKGAPGLTLPPEVTIELVWGDSRYEPTGAISVYERLRDEVVFLYVASPVEGHALKSRIERDGIPAMTWAPDEVLMYPPGWFFATYCTESERFAAVCDWIMANWQEDRPPRVALMGTDTVTGRAPEIMGTGYAQSIGIEMLPYEVIPHMPLDVSTQLLRLRERGADYVYITTIWSAAIPVLRDAERLGLIGKMRFGAGLEDNIAVPLIEALGPLAEGYFGARCVPWYEETPILWEILRQDKGKLDTTGGGATTLLYGPVPIEAIRIAIEKVGYENLNGRAVKEAFYSIENFDPYGIGRPVTYTPEDHRGAPLTRIYSVQGGKVVPQTDWTPAHMLVPQQR